MRKLEIRFIPLSRQVIQALFRGIAKNKSLQKLHLTHGTLKNATKTEFRVIEDAIKENETLLCMDLTYNPSLDEDTKLHQSIYNSLMQNKFSKLQRLFLTFESYHLKVHYLDLMDHISDLIVFVNDKILEDVDVQ